MTPANLPASIRSRLRNLAERDGVDFGAILTRYALERMLYRISIGEHQHEFLLKGWRHLMTDTVPDEALIA